MGRLSWRRSDGRWEYNLEEAKRAEAGFDLTGTYIWRRQNTIAQYIVTQPILYLCKAAESNQGEWVGMI